MTTRKLIIDGMLSGTGIRDAVEGGYLNPSELGLSPFLTRRIEQWLGRYNAAHYRSFSNETENKELDDEGIVIAKELKIERPHFEVEYFSDAEMRHISL